MDGGPVKHLTQHGSFYPRLPLAQFTGGEVELLPASPPACLWVEIALEQGDQMDFPGRNNSNHPSLLGGRRESVSLRESVTQWWLTNQLWISWGLLLVPLTLEIIYGTHILPYLILAPITFAATYLIYRNTSQRLRAKTDEITTLGNLHFATAEALATAIDAKDQTTHCHVRRVQIYAACMGAVIGLTAIEIAAL